MHEALWRGVDLKFEHANFFFDRMVQSLEPPRRPRAAMLEDSDAAVEWQRPFYANLDAYLVMARSVVEVINSCFGKDTATKEMRDWFRTVLGADEQRRRAEFFDAFENMHNEFRELPLSKARNISFHRVGYPAVEVKIVGRFGLSYIGSPVERVPAAELRTTGAEDDPNDPDVQWAATLPPVPVHPTWPDFQIDGRPLLPECQAYLKQVQHLISQARAIAERVHGAEVLTPPP